MLIRICYNADSDPGSNDRPERNLVIQCLHGKYYIFCFHFSVTIRLFVIIILRKKKLAYSTFVYWIRIHILHTDPDPYHCFKSSCCTYLCLMPRSDLSVSSPNRTQGSPRSLISRRARRQLR